MILFLSTNDTLGGAGMVTFRLVESLRRNGHDARMLVAHKDSDREWVDTVSPIRFNAAKAVERIRILTANGFNRKDLWRVSDASTGCSALHHPWVKEADTVVLGWICQGLLSLSDISSLSNSGKRIAWWMHDLWCATGICHLPPKECDFFTTGCGNCRLLHRRASAHDLSAQTFLRKLSALRSAHIRYAAVSRWQRERCLESPIFRDVEVEILGQPIDIDKFRYTPTTETIKIVEQLCPGLAKAFTSGKKIIALGAARLDDPIKGLDYAVEALNILARENKGVAENAVAVFFGTLRDESRLSDLHFPHIHIPRIEAAELPSFYSCCTAVLSTSHFETMGATLMEGMACGATPVTFATGGQTDIVTDGADGYIALYPSPESVAHCILRAINEPFSRQKQHESVAKRFSSDIIAKKLLDLLNF